MKGNVFRIQCDCELMKKFPRRSLFYLQKPSTNAKDQITFPF